jgi:hypothetical protein
MVPVEPVAEPDLGVSGYPVVLRRRKPRSRIRKFLA